MTQAFKFGTRVKLISFHGEVKSSEPVETAENFWVLVGQEGEVVSEQLKVHPAFQDKGKRAIIKFDQSLSGFGLANHNDEANSLWIFISDLEII
ncbi:MAG: hypothetical protein P8104_04105 [Gammaproteobacteria bacterium]